MLIRKVASINSDGGFRMLCMRISFSLGVYFFVWTDIATDPSGERSENLRNLTPQESTARLAETETRHSSRPVRHADSPNHQNRGRIRLMPVFILASRLSVSGKFVS